MQAEPKVPYVYQPDGIRSPNFPRIYAVAGPGTGAYRGKRFTKDEATAVVAKVQLSLLGQSLAAELGK